MSKVEQKKYPYIAILGPTASGKSSLAMNLAKALSGEIVSCDSVQIYKGFDVGSAKPTREEQAQVKHHMIDFLESDSSYDAAQYAEEARKKILSIIEKGSVPIVVGGTGLYYRFLVGQKIHNLPSDEALREKLKSLSQEEILKQLTELDPKRKEQIHENDRYRLVRALEIAILSKRSFSEQISSQEEGLEFPPLMTILLNPPRNILHERIAQRAEEMLELGLLEEVKVLRKKYPETMRAMQTIGYKEANDFLSGTLDSKEELLFRIICATRQYAKRQTTFFKKIDSDLTFPCGKEALARVVDTFQKEKKKQEDEN